MNQKITDNHKQNKEGATANMASKFRAFIAGLTPATIFKYTLVSTVVVALAAGIIYYTATDEKHVNIDKVETATVVLSGSDDLGGIASDQYKAVEWGVTNNSTSPAYVFIRIEMATSNLYEVVGLTDWCEVESAEGDGELIFAYGESGALTPIDVGDSVSFTGRLHGLADAVTYSQLTGTDMDIDVEGCLVYGTSDDGATAVYNTSALALWQAYVDNRN